jgi:hypothetical protein
MKECEVFSMNQLEQLARGHDDAKTRPNRPQNFSADRGSAACIARSYGAVTRINRFGVGGAWVGYDYLDGVGRVVMESMAAVGNGFG